MQPSGRFDGRRGVRRGVLAIAAALVGLLAITAFAVARSNALTAARARVGSRSERIAVNSRGLAVYDLVPETTRHLLCASSSCLRVWPPVEVRAGARVSAAGVSGKLGRFRRSGFTQLTLNGHPLYTYAGDGGRRGVANGSGVRTFGGTWHVFKQG